MKLLFDQNLSHRLVKAFEKEFPGSAHVRHVGLEKATDAPVWDYAKENGFLIVSKDADFHQRSFLYGHPPKVVWIRRGNCSTATIESILREHQDDLVKFAESEQGSFFGAALTDRRTRRCSRQAARRVHGEIPKGVARAACG